MKAFLSGHLKGFIILNAAVLVLAIGSCFAEGPGDEDIWAEDATQKISDEYADQIIKDIEKTNPDLAQKLCRLRNTNPPEFMRQLHENNLIKDVQDGISDEDKILNEEYFQWLKENFTEEAKMLESIKDKKPDVFEHHLNVSRRQYGGIMDVQKRYPALADAMKQDVLLTKQRGVLLANIINAEGQERENLIAELKKVIDARFDIIVKKKQLQYEALEGRIDWLQKKIEKQKEETQKLIENKDQKTKERLEELLSEVEKMNWEQ